MPGLHNRRRITCRNTDPGRKQSRGLWWVEKRPPPPRDAHILRLSPDGEKATADVIKNRTDYSDEPKVTVRVLRTRKRERRCDVRMEEGVRERSEGFYTAGFQEGGRSQEPSSAGSLQELEKTMERIL